MRIAIDIGHPAHVHYFKNFIRIMQDKGHQFLIIARNRGIIFHLLKAYHFDFKSRGAGASNFWGKILYIPIADFRIYKIAKTFRPDLFLSFGSFYAAHAANLLNKPHIAFDDTEHARVEHFLYAPFTDVICTPECFKKRFRGNHIRFKGYMELCYLHPNYFKPDFSVLEEIGVRKGEKFVLIRFVSWDAVHDIGQAGIPMELKRKLIKELSKKFKIIISSEGELPEDLRIYQNRIAPEKIHDVLAYAILYIGEGATMSSECAMLGTPAVYINSLSMGYLEDLEKLGLIFGFRTGEGVLEKTTELMTFSNIKRKWNDYRKKMLLEKIDVTAFMVWFIDQFPKSMAIIKENPDYQNNFRSLNYNSQITQIDVD